jgi:hypothetical protein
MLQKLSEEIQECYRHADESRQRAKVAFTDQARQDFLDMERRWLSLARSYESGHRRLGRPKLSDGNTRVPRDCSCFRFPKR